MSESNSKSGGIGLGGAIFLVFLILKLAGIGQVATWSWWWVTRPLWISALYALATITLTSISTCVAFALFCFNDYGATTMDALTASGAAALQSTLDVTGTSTLGVVNAGATSTTTLNATGAADLDAGLNVDGATTMDATQIDGDLTLNGSADISTDLDVDGIATVS